MKNLLKKWNESSLVLRILGGLIIGVVLGLAVPQAAPIGLLGDLFVGALKAVAPLLVEFGSCRKAQYVEPVTCEQMAERYKKEGI